MRLPKDYAAPKQEETAVEYIWEQRGCVQQRREPIVRCRDCRHMRTIDLSVYYYGEHEHDFDMCTRVDGVQLNAEPDGFCAWGERKADA